jgi:hypothetical protein
MPVIDGRVRAGRAGWCGSGWAVCGGAVEELLEDLGAALLVAGEGVVVLRLEGRSERDGGLEEGLL